MCLLCSVQPVATAKGKKRKVVSLDSDSDGVNSGDDSWEKTAAVPVTSPMSRQKRARQPVKYSFDDSDDEDM